MRTTDSNHLKQKRLPNGRFAPKDATTHPTIGKYPVHNNPTVPVTKLVLENTSLVPFVKEEPLVNHIALVIDESGSMGGIRSETHNQINNLLRTISHNAKVTGQKTTVTIVRLGSSRGNVYTQCKFVDSNNAEFNDYNPYGSTPLFQALSEAIDTLEGSPDSSKKNVSFLVMTITDGEENASGINYNSIFIRSKIDRTQSTDRWTYTFLMPPGKKSKFVSTFGIPEGNCREWESTNAGVQLAGHTTQQGVTHYYTARSLGETNICSFYSDLSKVDVKNVRNNLTDIQDKVKSYKVEKETEIRTFVEEKSGCPYKIGSAFYQLTKPETIQSNKQILVKEKNSSSVYGGFDSRKVLGFPEGKNLRITPGNHANWDLFVESNSTNRKLVRGTSILILK